jgi:hypothetical protein
MNSLYPIIKQLRHTLFLKEVRVFVVEKLFAAEPKEQVIAFCVCMFLAICIF